MIPIPYEIYQMLPDNLLERILINEPSQFRLALIRLIEKALKDGYLRVEKNGVLYPTPKLKKLFEPPKKKKDICNPVDCINFIENHRKQEFWQASHILSFERDKYLKRAIEDIPKVRNWKYLFVGGGNCLPDCLIELYDFNKEQFIIIDIDKEIINFYQEKGLKAYFGDVRFLADIIIPHSPFDVIISYQIEWFQTLEIIKFVSANLKNYGTLYLLFSPSEIEDIWETLLVFETLYKNKLWIIEVNPLYIKAIKLAGEIFEEFWVNFNKISYL